MTALRGAPWPHRLVLAALVSLGLALCLWQYAANVSLNMDEISVAFNVLRRSLASLLTQPSEYNQAVPPGFLCLEKVLTALLGGGDYVLRLPSLLFALVAMALFAAVASRVLASAVVPLGMTLFALAPPVIRYAAEVKPYSADIAVTLALTLLAVRWEQRRDVRGALALGLAGVVLIWFSYPALLVLVGLGAALGWIALLERDRRMVRALLPVGLLWGLAVAGLLAASRAVSTAAMRSYMQLYWREQFMPLPLRPVEAGQWLVRALRDLFGAPQLMGAPQALGYPWPLFYLLLALLGAWSLHRRARAAALLVTMPLVVAIAAAADHRYPLGGRVALFLVPALILLLTEGADRIRGVVTAVSVGLGRMRPSLRQAGAWTVMLALLAPPVWHFARTHPPYEQENTARLFGYLQAHRAPGEAVYVYYGAGPALAYYGARFGLDTPDIVHGQCHRGAVRDYLRELDRLRGRRRVWVVMAHTASKGLHGERVAILSYLDSIGERLFSLDVPSSIPDYQPSESLWLYDLSQPTRLADAAANTFPLPEDALGSPDPKHKCSGTITAR